MTPMGLTPRHSVALGLLALAPAAVYGVTRSGRAGLFAMVNIVIVIAVLYVLMSPVATHETGDSHGAPGT